MARPNQHLSNRQQMQKMMASSGTMLARNEIHNKAIDKYSTATNFQVQLSNAKRTQPMQRNTGLTIDQSISPKSNMRGMNVGQIRAASVMQVQSEQNRLALDKQKKPRVHERLLPMQTNTLGKFYESSEYVSEIQPTTSKRLPQKKPLLPKV